MVVTAGSAALSCELMGFSFNQPVSGRELWADFRYRGIKQDEGWGLVLYPDKSAQLFKDGKPCMESDLAEFLTRYQGLQSEILIGFVRKASRGSGGPAHQNSHPFLRELGGRDFVLAHEGTIVDYRGKLELGRAKPIGPNDSEFLCCYLVGRIEAAGIKEWNRETFVWMEKLLAQTSALGSVTSAFSDGEYLFVYLDPRDANDLYYVRYQAPYGKVSFRNLKQEIDLGPVFPASAKGLIFATTPLTTQKWKPLPTGGLVVLKKGEVVYTTHPLD